MANYKLQKYEAEVCKRLRALVPTSDELGEFLVEYYNTRTFMNFEASVIWTLWRYVCIQDGYEWWEKVKSQVSDWNDSHIHTLMRHAVMTTYHGTISDIFFAFQRKNDQRKNDKGE